MRGAKAGHAAGLSVRMQAVETGTTAYQLEE